MNPVYAALTCVSKIAKSSCSMFECVKHTDVLRVIVTPRYPITPEQARELADAMYAAIVEVGMPDDQVCVTVRTAAPSSPSAPPTACPP